MARQERLELLTRCLEGSCSSLSLTQPVSSSHPQLQGGQDQRLSRGREISSR